MFIKLNKDDSFASKSGFLRAAATAMRRILVDHARARIANKRRGTRIRVEWYDFARPLADDAILQLDRALDKLKEVDSQAAEVVELKFFSRFTNAQVAKALGVSVAISPNLRWLATGSEDHTVRLWNLAANSPSASSIILPHPDFVRTMAISSESHWLVTASGPVSNASKGITSAAYV